MYKYNFNKENCWYKKNCKNYQTDKCNKNCIRYMEIDYLMETSRIPKGKQFRNELIPNKIDLKNFEFLNNIKKDIVNFVNNRRKFIYL